MESGAKFLLHRILAHRCGCWTMRITIEPCNWFRHFMKENPKILLEAKLGVATAERRMKNNLPNVGVAARHGLFIEIVGTRPRAGEP